MSPEYTNSPIKAPQDWRQKRLKSTADSSAPSHLKRVLRAVMVLILIGFAGIGVCTFMTLMSIGVLIRNIDNIETAASDPLPGEMALSVTLDEDPDNDSSRKHLFNLFHRENGLYDLVSAIDHAATDPRVKTLMVRLNNPHISMASAQELRDAIKRFRASGKQAHIFTLSFGDIIGGTSDYYLATAFDKIWMQPTGVLGITGLHIDNPYFGGLLQKLGVTYDVVAREEYKSAMENLTLRQMSPASIQMMNSLLDNVFGQIINDIAKDRKLSPDAVRGYINNAPLTDKIAVKSGLIDRLGYRDEILATVAKDLKLVDVDDYATHQRTEEEKKLETSNNPQIALISGSGVIMEGADGKATSLGRGMEIEDIAEALDTAIGDTKIRAVVLRLNTPGGSPAASEYLRREIVRVRNAGKPVIISMGSVTASGGYWIASGGTKMVAQPGTLTGSIGVISGKPNIAALSAKYNVGWTSLTRGDNAGMASLARPYSQREHDKIESVIEDAYQSFLDRVAEARHIDKKTARSLAKGRVWTGQQALDNGLVDALGGIDVALKMAKQAAGMDEKAKIDVVAYPNETASLKSVIGMIKDLGVMSIAPMIIESLQQNLSSELYGDGLLQSHAQIPDIK